MAEEEIDDLERPEPRPKRQRSLRRHNAMDGEPDEGAEDFEVDESLTEPPAELIERFGEAMVSDAHDKKPMEFKAALDNTGATGPNGKKVPPKRKERWSDNHMVDLARGVPLSALQDDAYRVRGQNFVCLSFIFPESYDTLHCGNRLYRGYLIKVRGVFKTRENADRYIKERLLASDPHTKVYLARCFQWTTIEDDGDDDERTRESQTEEAEQLLRGYFENENERVSDFQRRINMVRSRNKGRAKQTARYFEEAVEERTKAHERDEKCQESFENTTDRMTLDGLKQRLESGESLPAAPPIIELSEDVTQIPGQAWACVTCILPKEYRSRSFPNEDHKRPLIKVRGIFATREEADQHIRGKIQPLDGATDVNLVPCFKWAGLDDDSVDDREYMGSDDKCNLRELLDEYAANGNNKIYATPQDRVRQARQRQQECAKRGIVDKAKMPFDARILPELTDDQLKALTDTSGGETSASAVTALPTIRDVSDESDKGVSAGASDSANATSVTVLGAALTKHS